MIFAGDNETRVSRDAGESWFDLAAPPVQYGPRIACSADGSRLVAVDNCGNLYTSADYGESWVKRADTSGPLSPCPPTGCQLAAV
jgi:photosystem II stability/assembly factor-like uncharacterized protein